MGVPSTAHGVPAEVLSAVAARDWGAAREPLEALHESGSLTAHALGLLAEMRVLTGDADGAKSALEQAVSGHESAGDLSSAATAATHLWRLYRDNAERSKATGWLRRAVRLVADEPDCVGAGHVLTLQSFITQGKGDLHGALEHARRAHEIARHHKDAELESVSLAREGRLRIRLGEVDEGQCLLDEAMTVVGGDDVPPIISAVVYCTVIDACTDLADYERAYEWTDSASSLCESGAVGGFPGICRIHRAELLRLRGEWHKAAEEAEHACAVLQSYGMALGVGMAEAELGMLRLHLGDLEAADTAFRDAHRNGMNAQPGRSLLLLARGDVNGAATALDRCIRELGEDPLGRAKLLPARVDVALAAGDLEGASAAAGDLASIAARFSSNGLIAYSTSANVALALALEDTEAAIAAGRRAVTLWTAIKAPSETSKARLLLAEAYERAGDTQEARFEREAATAVLDEIGLRVRPSSTDTVVSFNSVELSPPPQPSPVLADASHPTENAPPLPRKRSDRPPPAAGTVLAGKFELIRLLGRGGMGTVMEARHRVTGRSVAVKLLSPGMGGGEVQRHRLLQEALACGSVKHPNVVDIYDAGDYEGAPYIAMELLEGQSLADRLDDEEQLPLKLALDITRQALAGLQAAHAAGIVHRDLKPDNMFLVGDADKPTLKLLDFGISKLTQGHKGDTKTGALLGTPKYMSPEQIYAPSTVDGRTDIYSLGVVLYEMLCRKAPFEAETYPALLMRILNDPFPCISESREEADEALEQLVARATARERSERFAAADAFRSALEALT
jgi:tetratricopeptide (TPR) repeat protein